MKNKVKISVIDIMIAVSLAFAVISAIYRINQNYSAKYTDINSDKVYSVTIKTTLDSEYAENISVGDTVLDLKSNKFIGKVTNIFFSDYTCYHSATQKYVALNNRVNADITFVSGITDMQKKELNSEFMIVGESYRLALPDVVFDGVCISFEEVPNDATKHKYD